MLEHCTESMHHIGPTSGRCDSFLEQKTRGLCTGGSCEKKIVKTEGRTDPTFAQRTSVPTAVWYPKRTKRTNKLLGQHPQQVVFSYDGMQKYSYYKISKRWQSKNSSPPGICENPKNKNQTVFRRQDRRTGIFRFVRPASHINKPFNRWKPSSRSSDIRKTAK